LNKWTVKCDGGCPVNPGPGAFAFVIEREDGTKIKRSGYLPLATNNTAEYRAINAAALFIATRMDHKELPNSIDIFSDSQVIVRQLNGIYAVHDAGLRLLYEEANHWLNKLRELVPMTKVQWFGRENNEEADAACNAVMEKHGYVFVTKKSRKKT
jgi:ribonuclease HI